MDQEMAALAFVILIISILVIWKIVRQSRADTVEAYFVANKSIPVESFADSTVAYAYQVAALALFATWGFEYGLWTLWVPVFWGLGFQLLRLLAYRGLLERYMRQPGAISLFGFLAEHYRARPIARLGALVALVGLSGTAFFEAQFTAETLAISIGDSGAVWFLVILFVFVALLYVLRGGFSAVVATDRVQLSIGFIAFSICSAAVMFGAIREGFHTTGLWLLSLSAILAMLLATIFVRLHRADPSAFPDRVSRPLLVVAAVYTCALLASCFYVLSNPAEAEDSLGALLASSRAGEPLSLGMLSLVSLLLANGLWQLVDISNWQRLAALGPGEETRKRLDKTLTYISLYSPITWMLAIFFGMALKTGVLGVDDPWSAIQQLVAGSLGGGAIGMLILGSLLLALIPIMFSTLDSLISSLSHITYFDLGRGGNLSGGGGLRGARYATVLFTVTFLGLYFMITRWVSGADSILYTFYSFQLSLVPTVLVALRGTNRDWRPSFVSILVGSTSSLVPVFLQDDVITPYSAGAIFSLGGAVAAYGIVATLIKLLSRKGV